MDEDEDVDIVGGLDNFMSKNEREISNLSSGQILSCEYTVHPRWLTDNNDAAENQWPENLPKPISQDEMELVQDEVVIEEPAPIDFDWVEERETEEASNCGDIIFEQDIPASLEEEVVIGADETDNSDCCSQSSQASGQDGDSTKYSNQLPDAYVPESSTANSVSKGTPPKLDKIKRPTVKFKQTLMVSKNLLILNQRNFAVDPKAGTSLLKSEIREKAIEPQVPPLKIRRPETKFSVKLKLDTRLAKSMKKSKSPKKHKHRTHHSGKSKSGKHSESFSGKAKKFVDIHGENITINHDADESAPSINDETNDSQANISSHKARVIKHESDSDVDIDIESDTPNDLIESHDSSAMFSIVKSEPQLPITPEKVPPLKIKAVKKIEKPIETKLNVSNLEPTLLSLLSSPAEPSEEWVLPANRVSELEKYFHPEFFEGRPTKTPERYLKIRDFIVNTWTDTKPAYVSKTTVRNGLKHCGDVNCISRIHCMLEQIGAINFGYGREHFEYIRPLLKLKEHFMQSSQTKKPQTSGNHDVSSSLVLGRRQRNKSITFHSTVAAAEKEIDANYTVSHVNGVPALVYAAVPKERESLRREASKPIKVELELIECLRFAKDKVPPFKVSMTLSTLLCLYLHALSSKFEVMGFLGGYCTKSVGRSKLSLTRYKPCKTAHQTGTTCEMCPVSQVEQAANLTNEGYELVGWFHSHPTFEANPSRTDVATQADMQLQFSIESDRPFIGFILNCIDMGFNCMYILPKDIHKDPIDEIIPYGFEVDIIKDCSSLRNDIADVFNVIDRNTHNYVQTIEKFIKTGTELLRYHGYDLNIPDYLQSYL